MSKRIYVALDVHLKFILAVWQCGRAGRRVLRIDATPEGLAKLVGAVGPGEVWAVYEASSCGLEVYEQLTALGWKVWLLAPTHLPKSIESLKNKSDERDGHRMLDILVSHGELGTKLPWVWIAPRKIREDREVVRRRLKLAEKLGQIKNETTALLRIHGLKRPAEIKKAWSAKYFSWVRGLPGTLSRRVGAVLRGLIEELAFYQDQIQAMDQELRSVSEEPEYRSAAERMTELEGVGVLTAMTFLLELGDLKRFDNRRSLARYTGLTPNRYASSEVDHKGHISRMGPHRLRKVLNQAAWAHVRTGGHWAGWYQETAQRRGKKIAIVGLMRKLAIDLWHLGKAV
jgi:transposase